MSKIAFKLFACCIPVKGSMRSTICDLQRETYSFIPNVLFEILNDHENKTIEFIKKFYGLENAKSIDEYFSFLEENEYGFFCDNPTDFPSLNSDWESPEWINNAIIDVDTRSQHDYSEIANQFDFLGCKAIQLRFFNSSNLDEISEILNHFSKSRIRHIDLIMKFSESNVELLESFCCTNPRVFSIVMHSAPKNSIDRVSELGTLIVRTNTVIDSPSCCGFVSPELFEINFDAFLESTRFNSCLNKKISVDSLGRIRNCPSMREDFGSMKDISLIEVIKKSSFKKHWKISKNEIEVCKDCEFRHICTDCRAHLKNPDNVYSKPMKCNYNPYTATWENG
jgi:SPASM domain peptide maturase of grasp-with-spasm system